MKDGNAETEIAWLIDVRKQYQIAMGIITKLKDMNCKKKVGSFAAPKSKRCNLQLQKIPMPSFSGNIRDYPRFKSDLMKYMYFLLLKTPMRLHMY